MMNSPRDYELYVFVWRHCIFSLDQLSVVEDKVSETIEPARIISVENKANSKEPTGFEELESFLLNTKKSSFHSLALVSLKCAIGNIRYKYLVKPPLSWKDTSEEEIRQLVRKLSESYKQVGAANGELKVINL